MVTILANEEQNANKSSAASSGNNIFNVRGVIRDNWRKELQKTQRNNVPTELIENHVSRMSRTMEGTDYEAYCVPHIITNSTHMSLGELRSYLAYVEKLAIGYQHNVGSNQTNLMMIGITTKARDLSAIKKFHEDMIASIEKKITKYVKMSNNQAVSLRDLNNAIYEKNRGFFKFLRKGEINLLMGMIETRRKRITTLSKRTARYTGIATKVRHV